ncbi:MAG: hypothetical protein KAS52_00155 [Candidatus Heimdallarchaeota archaeon]|nr:hypothetical protein [Candidatus Heimdallarchaeota archaeon]
MLSVKKNLEKSIKKTEINQLPENLRTELITLGNLFDELQKIKEGKSKHHCTVRNMLHILMGQFENKGIDTSSEVQEIACILDEEVTELNWIKLDQLILRLYKTVFLYCN